MGTDSRMKYATAVGQAKEANVARDLMFFLPPAWKR